jgi:hypothetical protein
VDNDNIVYKPITLVVEIPTEWAQSDIDYVQGLLKEDEPLQISRKWIGTILRGTLVAVKERD